MKDQYSIWTWGSTDATFEGCTFNTNGKAILLYGSSATPISLVVNDCVFNDRQSGAAGKAAIEVGNDFGASYLLTINNAKVNGFCVNANAAKEHNIPTGTALWANKDGKKVINGVQTQITVTIDGTVTYSK